FDLPLAFQRHFLGRQCFVIDQSVVCISRGKGFTVAAFDVLATATNQVVRGAHIQSVRSIAHDVDIPVHNKLHRGVRVDPSLRSGLRTFRSFSRISPSAFEWSCCDSSQAESARVSNSSRRLSSARFARLMHTFWYAPAAAARAICAPTPASES